MASLQAAVAIEPYSADYTVQYNGFKVGEMSQRLERRDDGSYLMETVAYATGIAAWFTKDRVIERSIWRYHDGAIRPISYHYHYAGGRKKELEEKLDFDWDAMKISTLYKGRSKQLPLSPGVYDKQLYQLVLRHELANGLREFNYTVADRGKLREYHFELVGQEEVETPFGKMAAVKLKKEDTDLWLLRAYDYLVARLEKSDDGDHVVSHITAKSP
ncbi:MAG: DUF3108 domain-containing protein [Gammaproteobacteria bacterium]|nr:DUF3108 domain-containing protein [Gammaproteobacteria bacterium]MCW8972831.1 DUF3108 domain-containing protein [Gammaproteobacteria bacterium]MCW8992096.1 DUF3108 domain-containing protein [Gammaproteobacteria bacterium]